MEDISTSPITRPEWIRGKLSRGADHEAVGKLLKELCLRSVCDEGACPNRGECWARREVTFIMLGKHCTRGCRFCNIAEGPLAAPDSKEAVNIARAVGKLKIKYAVITSVTRDDLADKGAGEFVRAVKEIKRSAPGTVVELLIPDMGGEADLIEAVAISGAEVIGHNIEMPDNMYPAVRPGADYGTSLKVLRLLKKYSPGAAVKSSIMIGLGETGEDVLRAMEDLKYSGTDILYIGQYLSPSRYSWPVRKFYTPEEFRAFAGKSEEMGFCAVCIAPMARSSYRAQEVYAKWLNGLNGDVPI